MYFNYTIPVPPSNGKITYRVINGTSYVNYEYGRTYFKERKNTTPSRSTIGKLHEKDPSLMYPNANFYKYFPEETPPLYFSEERSRCLKIGAFILIEKIAKDYGLTGMISKHVGDHYGLFLDLMAYSIISEDNAAQYYPDYAFNHPLFTEDMHIYSDSTVSEFLNKITVDQRIAFLNEWNETRDHREKIYISYDSTNKECQAGNVEIAEDGHSKTGSEDKPVVNYSIAYDMENSEPLFYEDYCGSINDISQLQYMIDRAKGYGYRNIGFILDRGYFSQHNIKYMDSCGYDFIIMMKGMKEVAAKAILQVIGSFEKKTSCRISEYRVSGTTVKMKLFNSDDKDRYFHVYYSDWKAAHEREELERRVNTLSRFLKKNMGKEIEIPKAISHYFELVYWHEGKKDQKFMHGIKREDVIDYETQLCGYFIIITSKKMTAKDALLLYKGRDANEKLFRGDKSYLGNKAFRTYFDESTENKIFIEFAALIIRNRIYKYLKDYMIENDIKRNYLDVPAALKELEKIEMIQYTDGIYQMSRAVTKTQKTVLSAFGLDEKYIKSRAKELSIQLESIGKNNNGKKNNNDR